MKLLDARKESKAKFSETDGPNSFYFFRKLTTGPVMV